MSAKSVCFSLVLVLICGVALVVPASAQHFQHVTGSLTQVAAGRAEIWGLSAHLPYRFNPATKAFARVSTPTGFTQIAVGGGTPLQSDQVWALDGTGHTFQFNFGTKTFVNVPGVLSQIVVGEGDQDKCHPYEVWGIAPDSTVWRYNNCNPQWEQVQVPNPFTVIATGGGDVWGLDEFAQIWHYGGTWVQVTKGGFFGTLQQITVGVNDVWGLDGNGSIYRFDPFTQSFVFWPNSVDGALVLVQIVAGGNGVWGLGASGQIFRLDSSQLMFLQVPGVLAQIGVGYGGGVWGVNSSNLVYTFERP